MELKYIKFYLENCDEITFDGKYVGEFYVDNIHTVVARVACNAIVKQEICSKFFIELHRSANCLYYQFSQTKDEDMRVDKFERLLENDITHIEFEILDEHGETEKFEYTIDWAGKSEYRNDLSKTYISDLGHCYILIAKDEMLGNYIDYTYCNDAVAMNHHFSMYGIEKSE